MSRGRLSRALLLVLAAMFAAPFLYGLAGLDGVFSGRMIAIVFAIMPALSMLTVLLAVRSKPATRARLCLMFAACLLAVYLAEVALPLFGRLAAGRQGAAATSKSFDVREKLQVVLDLRGQGTDAVPSIEPKALLWPRDGVVRSVLTDDGGELLPVGGIANRLTVLCNEAGEWITHRSDRYGMNSPDSAWDALPLDTALIGDSFTNGWCCEPEEHFVSLITGDSRAVNLGMSGNGPLLILASLLELLPESKPRRVLWFHYEGNDFWDLEWERQSGLLMRYLEADFSQNLRARQPAVDREIRAYVDRSIEEWRARPQGSRSWRDILTLRGLRTVVGLKYYPAPDYELLARILARAKDAVEAWGGTLHFVYLPASVRYQSPLLGPGTYESVRLRVQAEAEKLGIDFIDLHPAFHDHGDPLSLFIPIRGGRRMGQYGHYTKEGNALVAETVLGALAAGGR